MSNWFDDIDALHPRRNRSVWMLIHVISFGVGIGLFQLGKRLWENRNK